MAGLSEISAKTLALLVDPAHLRADAIAAARTQFGDGANRHLVLDRFLAPHLLPLLRKAVAEDAEFEDNLKLASASKAEKPPGERSPRGKVDAGTFYAASAEDRFICQKRMTGAKRGHEGSPAMRVERFVREMLASTPLHEWLSAITGCEIAQSGGINLKLHGPGHFLKPHSDAREGRKLCAVIYLHEDWRPAYDGRFVLHLVDGGEKRIDTPPNRMILFEANGENIHAIEAIGEAPEGWWRVNYTVWFN